jgi:hypothetical protein
MWGVHRKRALNFDVRIPAECRLDAEKMAAFIQQAWTETRTIMELG